MKKGEIENSKSKKIDHVTLALERGLVVFHDQYGEPYGYLPNKQRSCLKLKSKEFARWLSYLIMKETGQPAKREPIAEAVTVLEAQALYEATQHELDVRMVNSEGSIWYDLGDGGAVRISKAGWEVTYNVPILFRKMKHQKEQVKPLKGGEIQELLEFVNLPGKSSEITEERLLFLSWVVSAFIPGFPHPILTLHGAQGSAKTTAFKILKKLIDPSKMDTLSLADSQREFVQMASHHYFIPLDNLTSLSADYSDLLCRICTGDGFSKRELFGDDEDVIYSYRRIIGLNGINITPDKADLLDRSLIIGFERIKRFGGERVFWEKFEAAKPRLLGAILDAVVKTLKLADAISEPENFRMADFAKYGCAVAEAMGYTKNDFLVAYEHNIRRQNDEALSASLVGTAILVLMENRDRWEGAATELLKELNALAMTSEIDTKSKGWPKTVHWVWRRIKEAKTNLEKKGIKVSWHETSNRTIVIVKVSENDGDVENVGDANSTQPT